MNVHVAVAVAVAGRDRRRLVHVVVITLTGIVRPRSGRRSSGIGAVVDHGHRLIDVRRGGGRAVNQAVVARVGPPLMAMPLTVTVLPVPAFWSLKVADVSLKRERVAGYHLAAGKRRPWPPCVPS